MIPIRYKTTGMIPEYLQFYDGFRAKIEKWVAKGRISRTNMFDRESTRFFEYLLRGNNLIALLNTPAEKLPVVIEKLKFHFGGLGRQDSEIMRICRVVFISHGYDISREYDCY